MLDVQICTVGVKSVVFLGPIMYQNNFTNFTSMTNEYLMSSFPLIDRESRKPHLKRHTSILLIAVVVSKRAVLILCQPTLPEVRHNDDECRDPKTPSSLTTAKRVVGMLVTNR